MRDAATGRKFSQGSGVGQPQVSHPNLNPFILGIPVLAKQRLLRNWLILP